VASHGERDMFAVVRGMHAKQVREAGLDKERKVSAGASDTKCAHPDMTPDKLAKSSDMMVSWQANVVLGKSSETPHADNTTSTSSPYVDLITSQHMWSELLGSPRQRALHTTPLEARE
jgi:hypothetical protein